MERLEKLVKDRSGILLILVGALLIFWDIYRPFAGDVTDGQVTRAEETVYSPGRVAGQALQENQMTGVKNPWPDAERQEQQNRNAQGTGEQAREDSRKPAGCLQLAGSSSMERYAGALAEGFMEKYPEVDVILQFTGSSAGIASVTGGSADIGMSSRYLTEEEKTAGAVENIAGADCIALCANPANGVTGLTGEQLSRLYTGEIADWSQLGGGKLPVVLIGREAGSGTRRAFEELLGLADRCTYANELDSTGAVMARIEVTPGAIGYVSLEAADRMRREAETEGGAGAVCTVLSLDGTVPSMENVDNGSYPLYRPFIMVTRGEAEDGNELVRAWLSYVESEEGRGIAEKMGIGMN